MEPISWSFIAGKECAVCKDGLCGRVNQLKEEGNSIREATQIMEKESDGKFPAETIRSIFKRAMSVGSNEPNNPKPKKKKAAEGEPLESEVTLIDNRSDKDTDVFWANIVKQMNSFFEGDVLYGKVAAETLSMVLAAQLEFNNKFKMLTENNSTLMKELS